MFKRVRSHNLRFFCHASHAISIAILSHKIEESSNEKQKLKNA